MPLIPLTDNRNPRQTRSIYVRTEHISLVSEIVVADVGSDKSSIQTIVELHGRADSLRVVESAYSVFSYVEQAEGKV